MADCGPKDSIVLYYGNSGGYRCGYCKSSNTNFSHGMWSESLAVQDYQDLLDRGWGRSGHYMYKPIMHITCCPLYTIRCNALDFKMTKSQKKVIKRFNRFLANNYRKPVYGELTAQSSIMDSDQVFVKPGNIPNLIEKAERAAMDISNAKVKSVHSSLDHSLTEENIFLQSYQSENTYDRNEIKFEELSAVTDDKSSSTKPNSSYCLNENETASVNLKKQFKPGLGVDISRPACKKAKVLRLERKKQKLKNKGFSDEEIAQKLKMNDKRVPSIKTLEDLINEHMPANPAHRLETVLVAIGSPEMRRTINTSWKLYVKYQTKVHGESSDDCSFPSYLEFLVNSPLKFEQNGPPSGYGSFHQQYWLDDQLIAVGVIDILPFCVSSAYFFYDPDYSDLCLGTYASLRETSFARSLHCHVPSIKYYYMGFYIDSCPKVRYKAQLNPSFLLCPETYTWHYFEDARLKIQKSKYSRLNDDESASDQDGDIDIDSVQVLHDNTILDYGIYRKKKQFLEVESCVSEYASLVGMKSAKKLVLVRT